MGATARKLWDYASYCELPEDGNRYEVFDGELCMSPAPNLYHQTLSGRIFFSLYGWVVQGGRGRLYHAPVDVVLGPRRIVQPDLVVVLHGGAAKLEPQAIVGAPDVVIEILSESTAKQDRGVKRKMYAEAGVRELWLVSPELGAIDVSSDTTHGFVEARTFHSHETLLSSVLNGLELPLGAIFADP